MDVISKRKQMQNILKASVIKKKAVKCQNCPKSVENQDVITKIWSKKSRNCDEQIVIEES